MSSDRQELIARQNALADFGELALRSDDLQAILTEACRIVVEALGADLAKILEIQSDQRTALVRAGIGWRDGIVGRQCVLMSEETSEAFALRQGKPIVMQNLATEQRFGIPHFMEKHGVQALVNVPIFLPGGKPYGILEVDAFQPREFADAEVSFLRTYAAVLGPVIDRLHKIADLERSDERFRTVVENAQDFAIILSDPEDRITAWFPGAEEILGWREDEVLGKRIDTIFTPQDQESEMPARERENALERGRASDVRWHVTKSGGRVFLDGQTIALRNADGSLQGFLKIAQNLTERKRNEERQAVLLAELQHRVRNVLALVGALLNRGDLSLDTVEFRDRLAGRIRAMSRTQTLLTRGAGQGVDLEGMIREELQAQGARDGQVALSGPTITLPPKAAEVLTLAVHELATNASKHGALSQAQGRVEVQWRLQGKGDETWFHLDWVEQGVQLEPDQPRRKGFGTELITGRVPYELGGKGEMTIELGGLACHIAFPLKSGESILQAGLSPSQRI
ncbi:sensor histidine kinase [Devosia submarina]|uniref:sensor histidine kinase n=1 Tax=Devosia submarina TaxID=1173082 RepID=UPI000D3C4BFE|nr:PAS domain S-box protein [Devosia submarina]